MSLNPPDNVAIQPDLIPPIKDQYIYNTCVAESITTILEMFHSNKMGLDVPYEYYSIRYLFGSDGGRYGENVMNFSDALDTVNKEGVPRWELVDNFYPQRDYKSESVDTYNDACSLARDLNHNDNSYRQRIFLPYKNGIDFYDGPLIDSCLRSGGYVLLGMDTPRSFGSASEETGIVPDVGDDEWRGDGHAVVIIGKAIIDVNGVDVPHWMIVNSWGRGWGLNGIGYIPYNWAYGRTYEHTYIDDEGESVTERLPYIPNKDYCFPVFDNDNVIAHPNPPEIIGARFVENDSQGKRRAEISFTIPEGCSVLIYIADSNDVLSITDPPYRSNLPYGGIVDGNGNVYYSPGSFREKIQYKWLPRGESGSTNFGDTCSTSPVIITLDDSNITYRVSLIAVNNTTKVLSLRSTIVDINGSNIFIYNGLKWVPATPYIYDGSKWVQAQAKIFQNGWK